MTEMRSINVGIVGGSGYTGAELLRLLCQHPHASVVMTTSRSELGRPVSDVYPNLRNHVDLVFIDPDSANLGACDVIFFATPHGTAMRQIPALLNSGARIIDLSADFRIKDIPTWERSYGVSHACPSLVAEAVYGLPEVSRDLIRGAQIVANPGCFPTAIQLGFKPLLQAGVVDVDTLIADAVSGVSGGGRKKERHLLFAEISDNFRAYSATGHRHHPEICQGLAAMCNAAVKFTFVPHLMPAIRGIHATLYARANQQADLQALFESAYKEEAFVDVLPSRSYPETRYVRGTNRCSIAVYGGEKGGTVVVLSVIDNLVKGAAGQAIQNMNIMFGFDEDAGLKGAALLP